MRQTIGAVRTAITVILVIAGPPWLLSVVAGSPLPRHLPSPAAVQSWLDDPLQPAYAGAAARSAAWLLWAGFTTLVITIMVRTIQARITAGRWPRLTARRIAAYLPRPVQGLTATVLSAAAITTATSATAGAHGPAPVPAADSMPRDAATRPLALSGHQTAVVPGVLSRATLRSARPMPGLHRETGRDSTYTVAAGDTLSAIAHRRLGDPARWPQIFTLNRGRHFPRTGGTLTNPNLIYPGWTLRLPDRTATPGPHPGRQSQPPTPPMAPHIPPTRPPAATSTPTPPPRQTSTPAPAASTFATPAATTPTSDSAPPAVGPVGDDGLTATPTPVTTGPVTATGTPAGMPQHPHRGITLSPAGWIERGLALAIAAAVAMLWAHRRHRYTPRPPQSQLRDDDPDLMPLPPVVTRIRRGLPATTRTTDTTDTPADDIEDIDPADTDVIDPDDVDVQDCDVDGRDTPDVGLTPLGDTLATMWPATGTGLIGPGAADAVRGLIVAALADSGRTQVVLPAVTAQGLLGQTGFDTPQLSVTATLDGALDLLDTHLLHRTRLRYQYETGTLTTLRDAHHPETLPAILLIAEPDDRHTRARITAALTQGHPLGVYGVLLGDWPDGDTITIADDGTTSPHPDDSRDPGSHPAVPGRFSVLTAGDAAALIGTLAEAHTGRPQPTIPTIPVPHPATSNPASPSTTVTIAPTTAADLRVLVPGLDDSTNPAPTAAEPAGDPTPAMGTPTDRPEQLGNGRQLTEPTIWPRSGPLPITVLGTPAITHADPHRRPRQKSLELLVYLAVNGGSATVDAILEDLLPDAPHSKAGARLHTYVSDLRNILRHNAGPGEYLSHPRQRYTLNPATMTIDLWQMRTAIAEATHAPTPDDRITALRRAVGLYRGHLAAGTDYLWIEPHREAVRRQALDATIALLDALVDQPEQQLAVCEPAITLHPYAESLYRQAMRAHHRLGHPDAISALRQAAITAAAQLDTTADADTLTLADHLLANPHPRGNRTAPGRGATA